MSEFAPYIRDFKCESCGLNTCQKHFSQNEVRDTKCTGCLRQESPHHAIQKLVDALGSDGGVKLGATISGGPEHG
jgi:hypothetical protein